MRSTICTSLAGLALAVPPAHAMPKTGCYARSYSAAHLAAHPAQVVAAMTLAFAPSDGEDGMDAPPGSTVAVMDVVLADQGHVARESFPDEGAPHGFGGAEMYNAFVCRPGSRHCGSPCWGGFDVVRDDGGALAIRTDYLMVGMGQDCGGFDDLTETPGKPVTFLLHPAPDAACQHE